MTRTNSEVAEILSEYISGTEVKEIVKKYKVSYQTLVTWRKKAGIKAKRSNLDWNEIKKQIN